MKKSLAFLCSILFVFGFSGVSFAYSIWAENGNWYEVVESESILWGAANSDVVGLGEGWTLATITSPEEQAFIDTLLTIPSDRTQWWIGGYQDEQNDGSSNNWNWVTGETWDWTNWDTGNGQPDDWQGDQLYLALDSNSGSWLWDDNTDTVHLTAGYIAEKAAPVPEPATMLLLGFGLVGLAGFRKWFNKA